MKSINVKLSEHVQSQEIRNPVQVNINLEKHSYIGGSTPTTSTLLSSSSSVNKQSNWRSGATGQSLSFCLLLQVFP